MNFTQPKGVTMARQISAMSNAQQQEYRKYESIAGRDPWYSVIAYRILLMFVDVFSIAGVFAGIMTWILLRFMDHMLQLATIKLAASAVISYVTFGMVILAAFIFAWTYFAARKFTPPIVEALAERMAGKGRDITVAAELDENIQTTDTNINVLYKTLTETPPVPITPPGWKS
jgi:hypothetical protein